MTIAQYEIPLESSLCVEFDHFGNWVSLCNEVCNKCIWFFSDFIFKLPNYKHWLDRNCVHVVRWEIVLEMLWMHVLVIRVDSVLIQPSRAPLISEGRSAWMGWLVVLVGPYTVGLSTKTISIVLAELNKSEAAGVEIFWPAQQTASRVLCS